MRRSKKGLGRTGINPVLSREKGMYSEFGRTYERQSSWKLQSKSIKGKTTNCAFTLDLEQQVTYYLIPEEFLQPSHLGNIENPLHFIPEAQPRNRATSASGSNTPVLIAQKLRPEEITVGSTAYTGAPIINPNGEVVQGNGRAYAMKVFWNDFLDQSKKEYIDFIIENQSFFGFYGLTGTKNSIKQLSTGNQILKPVLVRLANVSDDVAIQLGQYKQTDLEAISTRSNEYKSKVALLDDERLSRLLEKLYADADRDATLATLIRRTNLLAELVRFNVIRTDELELYTKNNEITRKGVEFVTGILINLIFKNGDTNIPEKYQELPEKAQSIIAKSAIYLLRLDKSKGLNEEIQDFILAYSNYLNFRGGGFQAWVSQVSMYEQRPLERYSEVVLLWIQIFEKARTQSEVVELFERYANAVKDKPQDMFSPARKGISKQEAINLIFKNQSVDSKSQNKVLLKARALRVKRLRLELEF